VRCITYANARPDLMDREDLKALREVRERGGHSGMATVAGLRTNPNFLPAKCPHEEPAS
jgi:hypothetical protein